MKEAKKYYREKHHLHVFEVEYSAFLNGRATNHTKSYHASVAYSEVSRKNGAFHTDHPKA